MDMELYDYSPAARSVWNAAEVHLTAVYDFSIIETVKDNPKEKTIHFGGIKRQANRQRYMDMTYDTVDKDGNIKTLPLFGDINVRTQPYNVSSPTPRVFCLLHSSPRLLSSSPSARPSKICDRRASCRKIQHSPATPSESTLLSLPLLMSFPYLLSSMSSSTVESLCNGLSNAMRTIAQATPCVLSIQAAYQKRSTIPPYEKLSTISPNARVLFPRSSISMSR